MNPRVFLYSFASAITFIPIAFLTMFNSQTHPIRDNEVVFINDNNDKVVVHKEPGIVWKGLGTVKVYRKTGNVELADIDFRDNQGRVNHFRCSATYDLPVGDSQLIALHRSYGSRSAMENNLIRGAVTAFLVAKALEDSTSGDPISDQVIVTEPHGVVIRDISFRSQVNVKIR